MIIKSHIRAGYRSAADYLKDRGENEYTRLVEISDPNAGDLDEAFRCMWVVATGTNTNIRKPLHHISINPFKDERLTDEQVLKIVKRCEEKYGYLPENHQRVIVEHIKDGRQHFHVIWNRVSLKTHRPVWPGHHWNKSKQVSREMERELGLKRTIPRRMQRAMLAAGYSGRISKYLGRYKSLGLLGPIFAPKPLLSKASKGKTGKGDGAGGGVAVASSALKLNPKPAPIKKQKSKKGGAGNGAERRRKNVWVPVERRGQKPK